jgi:hypothetical protein
MLTVCQDGSKVMLTVCQDGSKVMLTVSRRYNNTQLICFVFLQNYDYLIVLTLYKNLLFISKMQEKFEETNGVIRSRKSIDIR